MRAHQSTDLPAEVSPARLLRLPAIMQLTGLCRSTIYRMIANKQFPRPCKIGDWAVAWRLIEIEAWIDHRPSTH